MYETPRRIWRNMTEIPNYGWVVWEIMETKYRYDFDDAYDTTDRDGYSMFVTPTHYWTKEEATENYLRSPSFDRFELILVGRPRNVHMRMVDIRFTKCGERIHLDGGRMLHSTENPEEVTCPECK